MRLLRSLLFNLFFITWTMGFGLVGLPAVVCSQKGALFIAHIWGRVTLVVLQALCGIKYEIRGREHLTSQPVIYACKHQSAWDILMLLALIPRPAFVLKRELLLVPLMGWFYIPRQKMIVVNRGKGASALKRMLVKAKAALHERRPLIIYPEGTRTSPGAKPQYHPGIAALYSHLMVPVIPVALNSGLFWGKNAFIKTPGTVLIEFLPAIAPGLSARELMRTLEHTIETASNRLIAETQSLGKQI